MTIKARVIFFILLILSVPANSFSQDFKIIQPGIEYAQFTRKIKDEPVVVSALRLDLKKVRLDVTHAFDRAIGLETTSSMAARKGAIAAINAGFFRLDKSGFAGDEAGIFQIDGKLLSESTNNRIAMIVGNAKSLTTVDFAHVSTTARFSYAYDADIDISGLNRERKEGEIIVYTPEFGPSTLTDKNGIEMVFKSVHCTRNEFCGGRPIEIRDGHGNTGIPPDGYVISIENAARDRTYQFTGAVTRAQETGKGGFFVFSRRISAPGIDDRDLEKAEDIVAGVPQLIKNGKIDITWQQEKAAKAFAENRHPRTAVAKLKDGKFLMVAVDGRQPGLSVGMNLQELAEMLLEMGATDAMNLDGGGSTTMFLKDKVVNHPSDKEGERKVGSVILVFPRNK